MRFYTFEIVVEKEQEDDGYSAYSPPFSDVLAMGRLLKKPNGTFERRYNNISRLS